ncbi:MAG: hypothetical protein ACKOU7_06580, partial [Ferruginibacter sp.]
MKQLLPFFFLLISCSVFAQQKDSTTFNSTKKLAELVVKSKKPFIETQVDKLVMNVQSDIVASSGNMF